MKDILKAIVIGGIFAVPLLTLYVENDYFFPFITGKNFWFRIIVDVVVAAWVLLALYDTKYRPRFSWILSGFSTLLIVMFFANLLGKHPESSFWSNFERMDGYVSLVHTYLYMLVVGSIFKTRLEWKRLFNFSLAVAVLVAIYGLAQYGGLVEGSSRIDSRLGNAAYMAVYMLFHIFFAIWLLVESKDKSMKITYSVLALIFTFVLIETGTRGTALGLAVGVFVMSGYIGLFGTKLREFRKYAIGAFVILALVVAGFVLGRDTDLVQSNPNLARIANISISDLNVRGTIWGMAWEGVKERPLLGWGQSNFNYVFNEYYEPSLYAQEQWFDRSHNIIFDWLIAGGILGFLAYVSIFLACLYYLIIVPWRDKSDESFTVLERGILLGALAGYLTHNFVVFDNIVSYIFFALILAFIHSRVSTPIKEISDQKINEDVILQFATPVVAVIFVGVLYFAHMPGMATASDIIDAMREQNPDKRLEAFKQALVHDSFGRQEVVEQLSQNAISIMRDAKVPEATRQKYAAYTEEQLLALAKYKPDDARIHVFIGSYYRAIGEVEKASAHMKIARELSPQKQSIISQQGFIELTRNDNAGALAYFKEAYELDTRSPEYREYYATGLFLTGQPESAVALMDSEVIRDRFAKSDLLLSAANEAGQTEFLIGLFEKRAKQSPQEAQNWATLAYLYYQVKQPEQAIAALEEAKQIVPSFSTTADCFIKNIKVGKDPQTNCS